MNENFLQFCKCRLKMAIKSAQTWFKVIAIFVAYTVFFKQSGETSVFAYVCNIGIVISVFALVDVIFAYISWVVKNNKTKKSSK